MDAKQIVITVHPYTLVELPDGGLAIEKNGEVVCTEAHDGDAFNEQVGIHFGWRVELAVATRSAHSSQTGGEGVEP